MPCSSKPPRSGWSRAISRNDYPPTIRLVAHEASDDSFRFRSRLPHRNTLRGGLVVARGSMLVVVRDPPGFWNDRRGIERGGIRSVRRFGDERTHVHRRNLLWRPALLRVGLLRAGWLPCYRSVCGHLRRESNAVRAIDGLDALRPAARLHVGSRHVCGLRVWGLWIWDLRVRGLGVRRWFWRR
jgi:hypothetical protein